MGCSSTRWLASTMLTVLLGLCGPNLGAEETEPTPTPTPTPVPTPRTRGSVKSLAEIASKIRLKRPTPRTGEESGAVTITDENLVDLAQDRQLTQVSDSSAPGDAEAAPEGVDTGEGEAQEKKREYWRNRFRAQKKAIADLERRIEQLDEEIPRLWNQFYAWDDPAYRDSVIKPELDRKLQERQELVQRLPKERAKLDEIFREARRDGAQPGWFRNLDTDAEN